MALVTRSLVSRIAISGSTGTFQSLMAARTSLRASAAAAGSLVSRTRRWCSSVGRVGAIASIRFPHLTCSMPVARKMLLQLAVKDIGQLTDIERDARPGAALQRCLGPRSERNRPRLTHPALRKQADRPAGAASVIALAAVQELADGVHVAGVTGGLFDHVEHDPPQAGGDVAEVRVHAHLVKRMGRDDLVRCRALPGVLFQQLLERDPVDHHVGVLWPVLERGAFGLA